MDQEARKPAGSDVAAAAEQGPEPSPGSSRSEGQTIRWPEVDELLAQEGGNLGKVFRCLQSGLVESRDIVEAGGAANTGAVNNAKATIRALRERVIPTAPSRARLALGSARSLLRQGRPTLSAAAIGYLESVIEELDEAASNPEAQAREAEQLQAESESLEAELQATAGGVYVFSFPHYIRFPFVEGPDRWLLKVGMTTTDELQRVRHQSRQAGMPEDPVLLRIYRSPDRSPAAIERSLHRLLDAAGHARPSTYRGGREWFVTSLEYLDTLASELGFTIVRGSPDDE